MWVNVDSWGKPASRRFIQAWPTQKLRQTGAVYQGSGVLILREARPYPSNPCRAGNVFVFGEDPKGANAASNPCS